MLPKGILIGWWTQDKNIILTFTLALRAEEVKNKIFLVNFKVSITLLTLKAYVTKGVLVLYQLVFHHCYVDHTHIYKRANLLEKEMIKLK